MQKNKTYTKGILYRRASELIDEVSFKEFERVFFCNVLSLYETEKRIIKSMHKNKNAYLFFQGNQKDWTLLDNIASSLLCEINSKTSSGEMRNFDLYQGFDTHSQVSIVKELIKKIDNLDNTVIVLPDSKNTVPLLSEIASFSENVNVAVGYPLKRSATYALFESIFEAQNTRKESGYYARDYLRVLTHPFSKNIKIFSDFSVTRIIVHKIEEALTGIEKTALGGSLFVNPKDIEESEEVIDIVINILKGMGIKADSKDITGIIAKLNDLLFYSWEDIGSFEEFSIYLEKFLDTLINKSYIDSYPVDLSIVKEMLSINEEFKNTSFGKEKFRTSDIFKIFLEKLKNGKVKFLGSPIKGLQVLGLLETRALNFENVIVMDMNEAVLPKLKIYEPLIPQETMSSLGLGRPEKEEEIQRYHFMRLIASAKKVHLVYEESPNKEKSRFLEELIWEKEKEKKTLKAVPALKGQYSLKMSHEKSEVKKTLNLVKFLTEDFTYSATSINTYIKCPLRFYYQYILGLREKKDLLSDLEGSSIGIFIHELLEDAFSPFENKKVSIDTKFKEDFFSLLDKKFNAEFKKRMKSDAFAFQEILKYRLGRFLETEEERSLNEIDKLLCVEKKFKDTIKISGEPYKFTAKVDRIDMLRDGSLFVIDYKSGGEDPMPKTLDKIKTMKMTREDIRDTVKSFQLPLYLYLARRDTLRKSSKCSTLNACLYYLKTSKIEPFLKPDDIPRSNEIVDMFMEGLKYIIREINDPKTNFTPDDKDAHYCENCPFFYLCR